MVCPVWEWQVIVTKDFAIQWMPQDFRSKFSPKWKSEWKITSSEAVIPRCYVQQHALCARSISFLR